MSSRLIWILIFLLISITSNFRQLKGNWAYRGKIQFDGLKISTQDLPVIIPILQKQQGSLRYFCNAGAVPESR